MGRFKYGNACSHRPHRRIILTSLNWLALCAIFVSSQVESAAPIYSFEIFSEIYTVDKKYRSMKGPQSTQSIVLLEGEEPELLWITGYETVVMDSAGDTEMPQDFMCHSNLNIDMKKHRKKFGWHKNASRRLFTLSQGQARIRFPEGFGIPIMSNELLQLQSKVLNLNVEGASFQVRHRVMVNFVRNSELSRSMQALFMKAANGLVVLDSGDGYYNVGSPDSSVHGEGCLVGERAEGKIREDNYGRKFSGHWVVRPGREENHTLVTEYMNLPFDTTVHYISTHLHPFSRTLELYELTVGKTVFVSKVRNFEDKIGLEHVDTFTSIEGIPLYRDHEYELISVYENTSDVDQDSMAVMFLYVLDKEFDASTL